VSIVCGYFFTFLITVFPIFVGVFTIWVVRGKVFHHKEERYLLY
jgi:hypothetical protein